MKSEQSQTSNGTGMRAYHSVQVVQRNVHRGQQRRGDRERDQRQGLRRKRLDSTKESTEGIKQAIAHLHAIVVFELVGPDQHVQEQDADVGPARATTLGQNGQPSRRAASEGQRFAGRDTHRVSHEKTTGREVREERPTLMAMSATRRTRMKASQKKRLGLYTEYRMP